MTTRIKTEIARAYDVSEDREAIEKAARLLREGKLVIFPTETVYGLGANALNREASAGIFRAKGRPQDNPLIVHVTSPEEIYPLVKHFPKAAERLAEHFWPGPLTLIMEKSGLVPSVISAGLDTVAIRMPSNPIARAVISISGVPIAAPSANVSGSPSPTTVKHCIADMSGRVDMILDGGDCTVGVESTVLSLAEETPRLFRPGAVTLAELEEVLGNVAVDSAVTKKMEEGHAPSSPGMKYKHYAPKAKLVLVHADREAFARFVTDKSGEGKWFLAFDEDIKRIGKNVITYGSEASPLSQARRIFSALRELDEAGAHTVYARAPSTSGVGLAVYNRLIRAAGFEEIYLYEK